jgi:hypothetical protein
MKKRKKNVAFVNKKKKKKRLGLASLVYAILLSLSSLYETRIWCTRGVKKGA